MKSEFPNSPEDRLLDELLREQSHGPDVAFLQQIESAVDAGLPVVAKPPVKRNLGRYASASVGGLAAAISFFLYLQNRDSDELRIARGETQSSALSSESPAQKREKEALASQELDKAIRNQEDKLEERRKVLATIVRTKGINYKGQDSFYGQNGAREEVIERGLDAQNYADAKRDFESDVQELQSMTSESKSFVLLPPLPELASNDETLNRRDGLSGGKGGSGSGRGAGLGAAPANESSIPSDKAQAMRQPRARVVPARQEIAGNDAMVKTPTGGFPSLGRDSKRIPAKNGFKLSEQTTGDKYGTFVDQPWKSPAQDPLSTFSIDVDTASYANVRRMIREGREIPRDAVRIEEFINAFKYHYDAPKGEGPFAVGADLAVCPWAPTHQLVRISIKGREIETNKRPASNLVFLIDVSGSMQSSDKLPLLRQSMETMVSQLGENDRVAIVVYAGSEGVALRSTRLDEKGRAKVLTALAKLEAGGSTNGGAGINRAYQIAMKNKIEGGVNRVILATDGDFNVGVTGQQSLVDLVKERAKGGVYLTVAGFGTGNLNDAMMEAITHDGNGNYFYIDSEREGQKVFFKNLSGTLVTIAKDVKIQVEFNSAKVGSYRLIGYANRVLRNEDFNNDRIDAGDIGAGHTVTAFYELAPPGARGTDDLKYQANAEKTAPATDDWLTVKLRYKHPDGDESRKIELPLKGDPVAIDKAGADFQFATAAALLGMKLRGMEETGDVTWDQIIGLAKPGLADDVSEDRAEFVELVKKLVPRQRPVPAPAEIAPGNRDH